MPPLAL